MPTYHLPITHAEFIKTLLDDPFTYADKVQNEEPPPMVKGYQPPSQTEELREEVLNTFEYQHARAMAAEQARTKLGNLKNALADFHAALEDADINEIEDYELDLAVGDLLTEVSGWRIP